MDKNTLRQMLDLTYELEGLIEITFSRDNVPEGIFRLIDSKLKSINGLWKDESNEEADGNVSEGLADSQNDEAFYNAEEIEGEGTEVTGNEPQTSTQTYPQSEAPQNKLIGTDVEVDDEEEEHSAVEPEEVVVFHSAVEPENLEETKIGESDMAPEVSLTPTAESIEAARDLERVETSAAGPSQRKSGPSFSINDRFLYARELFGGNISDFERALKDVVSLYSYEEAEEYFYSEWDFDPENPVVADFMIRISNYFA